MLSEYQEEVLVSWWQLYHNYEIDKVQLTEWLYAAARMTANKDLMDLMVMTIYLEGQN